MELQSIKDEYLFLKKKNAHSWPILLEFEHSHWKFWRECNNREA